MLIGLGLLPCNHAVRVPCAYVVVIASAYSPPSTLLGAPVALSHALLPAMRERGNGALLFTGSIAGRQAVPLHGLYAASKAFQLLFGESLHVELRGSGIDVLVVEPGVTDTEFQKLAGERPLRGEPPARVVAAALACQTWLLQLA